MKLVERLTNIFSKKQTPHPLQYAEESTLRSEALILDDSETFSSGLAQAIGTSVPPIVVKNKTIPELLRLISTTPKETEAILVSSHLLFDRDTGRYNLNGVELVQHIRLTESLEPVNCLPIIVYGWDDLVSCLKARPDNVILLASGMAYVQLPATVNTFRKALEQIERFNSFAELKQAIRDHVLLTSSEQAASSHDYRNKAGVAKLTQEFALTGDSILDALEESYREILDNDLWLKKYSFINSLRLPAVEQEQSSEEQVRFKELTRGKKFLYIDDQHRVGWSYVLYAGLSPDNLSAEFFKAPDRCLTTPNGRFVAVDSYDLAMSMVEKEKNEFDTLLARWAEAEWRWSEANRSLRSARQNLTVAEKTNEEISRRIADAEKNLKACEISSTEKRNSFREKTKAFAQTWAEIETGPAEMPDTVIEDKKYQEGLEILNTARRDFVDALKSYQSAQKNLLKLKDDQSQSQKRLESTRIQFDQSKQEYESSKDEYENTSLNLHSLFPWNLIFLDLRLVQPDDETIPIKYSGGMRLLDEIKSFDPSIPIIVFTASEKAMSYEESLRLGADAYWMKGISSGQQLRGYIVGCVDSAYLKEIWLKIRKVDAKKEIHCLVLRESGSLEQTVLTQENLERKQILKLLRDSFFLLRSNTASYGQSFESHDVYGDVALNMGLIQEIRYKEGGEGAKLEGKIWNNLIRENKIPRDEQEVIRSLRNIAVHAFELRRSGNIRTSPVAKEDALKSFHLTLDRLLANP